MIVEHGENHATSSYQGMDRRGADVGQGVDQSGQQFHRCPGGCFAAMGGHGTRVGQQFVQKTGSFHVKVGVFDARGVRGGAAAVCGGVHTPFTQGTVDNGRNVFSATITITAVLVDFNGAGHDRVLPGLFFVGGTAVRGGGRRRS